MEFHVATCGNNNWNGLAPEPNPAGTDGPLASLNQALRLIRQLRRQNLLHGTATVTVHAGTYTELGPIAITPEDSDLRIRAAAGERVVFSGGTSVDTWEVTTLNDRPCWIADVDNILEFTPDPRSLYVNDQPRPRSRWPKTDWLTIEAVPDLKEADFKLFDGSGRFIVREGDFNTAWRNPSDIMAVASHLWTEERLPVAAYNPETREVRSSRYSIFTLRNKEWMDKEPFARYFWENVFEALSEPGEWYLDRKTRKLYYLPKEGESPETTSVVMPHLCQILRIHGDVDAPRLARNIHIKGIEFLHTDWSDAEGYGKWWDPCKAPSTWREKDSFRHFHESSQPLMRSTPWPRDVQFGAMPQAAHDLPGAVSFEAAVNCSLSDCRLACHGFYGIDVRFACKQLLFAGNTLELIGGGGLKADGADALGDPAFATSNLNISDNTIRDCGLVFASAVGICILHAGKNRIVHNHIHRLFYTGISVGWVWSYDENVAGENLIGYNHIHTIGQRRLSDMGAIYTLGRQPGTLIIGNHIHDVFGTHYGGWGIYLDEGSSLIRVEHNLVYRTGSQGLHEHWGRQNVYLDNVFAFSDQSGIILAREDHHGAVSYPPRGCLFMRNVVLTEGKPAFKDPMTYLEAGGLQSDLNLYWDINDKADMTVWDADPWPHITGTREKLGLDGLHSRGLDLHSKVADPGFKDPANGDFSVSGKDTPLLSLGIRLPAPEKAGVRPPEQRALHAVPSYLSSAEMVFGD